MDSSPPGSSVHGILQVWILVWITMPSFRGFSWPKDQPASLVSPALAGLFSTISPPGKAQTLWHVHKLMYILTVTLSIYSEKKVNLQENDWMNNGCPQKDMLCKKIVGLGEIHDVWLNEGIIIIQWKFIRCFLCQNCYNCITLSHLIFPILCVRHYYYLHFTAN